MRTVATYKYILNSEETGHKLIDQKALSAGHTKDVDIYAGDGFDSTWKDHEGNEVTSGYRLTADHKSRVLITIVNSYQKDQRNKALNAISINND